MTNVEEYESSDFGGVAEDTWEVCARRLKAVELRKLLSDAICELPGHQRTVIEMRYMQWPQAEYEEIAQCIHVQVNTARSLARHGRKKLRIYLEKRLSFIDELNLLPAARANGSLIE